MYVHVYIFHTFAPDFLIRVNDVRMTEVNSKRIQYIDDLLKQECR